MNNPACIIVMPNLNVAAFDSAGEQIPELQRSVAYLVAEHGTRLGYTMEGALLESLAGTWRLQKDEEWGWRAVPV